MKKILTWTAVSPVLAWVLYFSGLMKDNSVFLILGGILLILSVLSAVHYSEIIAHKVGEPFGTIILAVAITVIEVALIVSLMISGGKEAVFLARDTVFAAVMLILNGIIGACLLIGGIKHFEQFFERSSTNTALVSLITILVLTLVLPNYTTSIQGPSYSEPQLIFVALACLIIYGTFILVQTVRHRNYFLSGGEEDSAGVSEVSGNKLVLSLLFLLICLTIVVLLAKSLSPSVEEMVRKANLPQSLVGVIIAIVVLLPEGIAAIKASLNNKIQISLNLALGSALASIGLTIPSVAIVSKLYGLEMILGLDMKSMVLLALSVFIVMLSLSKARTNILYGVVLLVNFMAYIFTVIFP